MLALDATEVGVLLSGRRTDTQAESSQGGKIAVFGSDFSDLLAADQVLTVLDSACTCKCVGGY
jgi:hypothetical protein